MSSCVNFVVPQDLGDRCGHSRMHQNVRSRRSIWFARWSTLSQLGSGAFEMLEVADEANATLLRSQIGFLTPEAQLFFKVVSVAADR